MKKGVLYAVLMLGVLALSTSAIFVRLADAPASVTAFYRLFFTVLVLVPFVLSVPKERKELLSLRGRKLAASLLSGIFLAVHYVLWFESLSLTSVASSTVIVTLQPVFTMLYAFVFLRERQRPGAVAGCLIAIVGSAVIGFGDFRGGGTALVGDLMALLAAAVISAYFFIGERLRKDMSALVYTVSAYTGSVVFLFLYTIIKGDSFFGYSAGVWGCFIGIAVVSTVLGQCIFNVLLKWLSSTTIATGVLGEPVGTCILAYFILGEVIVSRQWIGMIIILAGLFLYFISAGRKKSG